VGQDPPPGTSPCTNNPATSPCQNEGNTISNNTFGGTSGAGVELQLTGGFTMTGNTVSGLGAGGEGFVLVGSDNNSVSTNNVSNSAAGVIVTGNDLTGPSTNNTVSNNDFSSNLLGGAAADGFGSPESWNKPGTGNQGVQGEVFFQSGVNVPAGPTGGTGMPFLVTTPTSFGSVPGAYSSVVTYLGGAGAICGTSAIPVDNQGGNLYACTDGINIYLQGVVGTAITAGNGNATGPSPTSEPGCEASPPANTGQPSCTGDVLTMSALPSFNQVAEGNTFNSNVWNSELIVGAIDGSGPNGQLNSGSATYLDGNPDNPATIMNTWNNNTGSPANSAANPTTAAPAAGT
jgi:parallel beta-helix repeat protein